jgi:eukaryotic-like serine/threonine-protein kinase
MSSTHAQRRAAPSDRSPATDAHAPPYAPGFVIASKYELTRVLGEGGMGSVWLARNLALDADVAVKLIRPVIALDESSQRLLGEARAAARLGHPAIVRVFDFGTTELGDPFIVMELLPGETLADVLDRQGRLPASQAVQLLLPIASALAAAHAKGIVHRDVKPENVVLVRADGGDVVMPKLVDFGVAIQTGSGRRVTTAGAIVGSPDYMSPEQARGSPEIDERSDVFSFAVLLYECVAGERPFSGESARMVLTSIVEDEPTPTTHLLAGDEALWTLIRRGIAKDPALRWASMREFGRALAQWLVENGVDVDATGASLALHWASTRPSPLDESHVTKVAPPRPRMPWTQRRVPVILCAIASLVAVAVAVAALRDDDPVVSAAEIPSADAPALDVAPRPPPASPVVEAAPSADAPAAAVSASTIPREPVRAPAPRARAKRPKAALLPLPTHPNF